MANSSSTSQTTNIVHELTVRLQSSGLDDLVTSSANNKDVSLSSSGSMNGNAQYHGTLQAEQPPEHAMSTTPMGVLAKLPAELFEVILNDLFNQAFNIKSQNWPARDGLRKLAGMNSVLKQIIQREMTHFFSRWSYEMLREGHSWCKIAGVYHWVRDRSMTIRTV